MYHFLDFEKSISVLEGKIEELRNISSKDGLNIGLEVSKLEEQLENKLIKTYSKLTPWDKVKVARHPLRPHPSEIIKNIFKNWQPLAGDRGFKEDNALLGGIANLDDNPCVVIGIEKGKTVDKRIFHNFGMVRPEGYRKAKRIMKIAEKFKLPIITFIDTPGAYPGIGAEERGQAQAIADNLFFMSRIKVPIISVVIGEGASGGALAIGLSDKILCLEHTWYSVISPEGCASILFRDTSKSIEAANSMKVTSNDLYDMGIADEIINEPLGGAHHNIHFMSKRLKSTIIKNIDNLLKLNSDELIDSRLEKYNRIGKLN